MLIAHISDLHLNSFYNDSVFNRTNLILKKISERQVDHLVITGDITDNANENDLEAFRMMLIKYGFIDGRMLTIIPGNHDIFGGVQKAEDIVNFPEKCSAINYHYKLATFISYFPEAFNNCLYISPKNFFPFIKNINGALLIGINSISTYSKIKNPFGSNGRIDALQFKELYSLLHTYKNDNVPKLVLIHHHFNKLKIETRTTLGSLWLGIEKQTMKLRGKRKLINLFNEFDVDIVLHGHTHESKEYFRKGLRFLNAGGSIINKKDSLIVNYISIGKTNRNIEIQKIVYDNEFKAEFDRNDKNKSIDSLNPYSRK